MLVCTGTKGTHHLFNVSVILTDFSEIFAFMKENQNKPEVAGGRVGYFNFYINFNAAGYHEMK